MSGLMRSLEDSVLDKEGGWEFAVTIRRNGRRVAVADCLADTYEGGIWTVSTILQCRDVTFTGAAAREMSHEETP